MNETFSMGSIALAFSAERTCFISESDFWSWSRSEGEIVRKSQPASEIISEVCSERRLAHLRKEEKEEKKEYVSERSTHDDSVVAVLLVVVVDLGDGNNSRVGRSLVLLVGVGLLVPIEDTSDERRDEGDLGLSARDGLFEAEEQREVAMDVILLLELTRGLDTLPGRGNLDEDALLGDSDLLVEGDQVLGLPSHTRYNYQLRMRT
jgi:hypothetical protein